MHSPYLLPSLPHRTDNFGPRVIVQEGYSRPPEGKRGRVGATKHTSYYTIPLPITVCGPLGRGPLPFLLPPPRFPHLDCTRRLESSLASCLVLSGLGIFSIQRSSSVPLLVSNQARDDHTPTHLLFRIITCAGSFPPYCGLDSGTGTTRTGASVFQRGKPSIPVVPFPVEAPLSPLFAFLVLEQF